ncbi:MAG: metallophosphoesterase family protein [Cyanobacteria bacterium J06597_1]
MNNNDPSPATQKTPARSRLPKLLKSLAILLCAVVFLVAGGLLAVKLAKNLYRSYWSQPPTQIHLAWDNASDTSITLRWHTRRTETSSLVDYRLPGETEWSRVLGHQLDTDDRGVQHEATINNLEPNTTYEYRIKADFVQPLWSDTFQFTTAPPVGDSDFDVIYVADTGLVGRKDGLDTGTQQMIDEIAQREPLLILGGGDYAYYSSDDRHGPLVRAIDAWFEQMTPVLHRSVLMPTYGNHETVLKENVSLWQQRFATPPGAPDGHNYSFNVGNVHFVSIFAIYEQQGLEPDALEWIEQDIRQAQDDGFQWIVPYMHVAPFAEGASHPSNLALRAQLGPLFEQLGIEVVLTSHDQAFERTYPIVGVPDDITATSESTSCYAIDDGVTWVKTSPGGKLSNKSGGFSVFKAPPSAWVAVRDNTMHVFTKLHVSTEELVVETFGLQQNGQSATLLDSFVYKTQGCDAQTSDT